MRAAQAAAKACRQGSLSETARSTGQATMLTDETATRVVEREGLAVG